jgi:ribose transport system substrate-binding protein
MRKIRVLLSLPNQNRYQQAQMEAASAKAVEFDMDIRLLDAENDAVNQSQQILKVLQSRSESRPDAILVEPLTSTALGKVAEAAVASGIGWVVLNTQPEYVEDLRAKAKAPIFAITRDHAEIGRIQGRQFAALLPHGGTVLYVQGPSTSSASAQRTSGMYSMKPENLSVRTLRSQWTEGSAQAAVRSWLMLSTSQPGSIDLVGCQYDGIARGARQAFEEQTGEQRHTWLSLPSTGVDGLPDEGQVWVKRGELTATVVAPITTEIAMAKLMRAIDAGKQPEALTFLELRSYPSLQELSKVGKQLESRKRIPARQ